MSETSGLIFRRWLLLALDDLDGSGRRPEVHGRVEKLFGSTFTAEDRAPRMVHGVPREPAWRNNLDSLYDRMKKAGQFEVLPARSPWTLTASGKRELLTLAPVAANGPSKIDESDLLKNFKPKSSSEYLSHVRGQVLVKSRSHEDVLAAYGTVAASLGWIPTTAVHPRDLELQRGADVCLAEIKVVYDHNATRAVREAVAQLFEYRYFHYSMDLQPVPLAVFSEAVGDGLVLYLQALGIATVWQDGVGWGGSTGAVGFGLVP